LVTISGLATSGEVSFAIGSVFKAFCTNTN